MKRIYKKLFVLLIISTLCISISKIEDTYALDSVYTVKINRFYRNPRNQKIEDSGGENSFAIGQGMVEGAIESFGILEKTDEGTFLTFRIKLMDFTKNHSFYYQRKNETTWHKVKGRITKRSPGKNGEMADIVIKIEDDVLLKGTMFVIPMGRDVVWFMKPNVISNGNKTDMVSKIAKINKGDYNSNNISKKVRESNEIIKSNEDEEVNKKINPSDSMNKIQVKSLNNEAQKSTSKKQEENLISSNNANENGGGIVTNKDSKTAKDKEEKETSKNKSYFNFLNAFIFTLLILGIGTITFLLLKNKEKKERFKDEKEIN